MDSWIGIIGLAVGIGAFVPAFFPKQKRIRIVSASIAIIALVSVALLFIKRTFEETENRKRIENTKFFFETELKKKSSQTFEEMFQGLHYTEYSIASSAIDELVEDRVVQGENMSAKGDDGVTYTVRVYHLAKPQEP